MEPVVSILLDTRREKRKGVYPLKLRVYYKNKTIKYPLVYNLSKEDFDKLGAKRISDSLAEVKAKLSEIEFQAMVAARKISPFDFEAFYHSFVRDHTLFIKREKGLKAEAIVLAIEQDIPAEWKKKFGIFAELAAGPDYISSLFYGIIRSLLFQNRVGTAGTYQTTFNSLKTFRGNIRVGEITPRYLMEYEGWMINQLGNSPTTVGIYARMIRAVVNEAIEKKLLNRDDYPFGRRRYRIPTGRNIKKALGKESISKLYYAISESKSQQKAKDFWFFSFYANGMNVKDIICLKYKNIKGDFLVFERAKTESTTRGGEPVIISCFMNQDMLDIIERWGNKDKDPDNYIFPVLKPGLSPIRQFEIKQNFTRFINKNMAKVSLQAEIDKKVNTMETRHSASTLMKNAGVSPHFIKESLGHTSLKTTENYLAGFENEQKKEYSKVLDGFKKIE